MTTLWDLLPAMSLFAFVTAITPGPNNLLLANSGAQFGVRESWRHLIGIRIGVIGLILLCACGVGVAFQTHPNWYLSIKYVGVAYMLWLMIKLLCTNPLSGKSTKNKPISMTQATLFQLGNMKAWMASLALVTSYSLPSSYWFSVALITVVFTTFGLLANIVWVWFGEKIRIYLDTVLKQRLFNISLAAITLISLLPVLEHSI
ncbi:LysE family translocator [Vibrio campbellii]|uniref:LysE family translocator n=1 Tax=Vibrio campbellii TaxID=680 RepID=A0AAE9SQJ8_9VIBR|nr:LysE family translocator [Vibrio campbellii]ARV75644.1 lysine transporter LysE [Vibrio campbellii CAIM 519 = NBRC 15631 = ATCC 25920]ELU49607.1 amino acid transporter LysE [Vibrio campbellii CAIM 519 = NBRC 15631 = ATCC 25920]UTZ29843.1 LysE family translocator [Vibrio campbellii]HDM8045851.1 LysE family translocator [Vibrio campbellii]|tara:strand:- start:156 stop:764 length:609 start_codon:yes stop_codon:yes gene_type:complete